MTIDNSSGSEMGAHIGFGKRLSENPAKAMSQSAEQQKFAENRYSDPVQMSPRMSNHDCRPTDVNRLMQYDARKKSLGVAYLLLFFFGMIGAHRFYIGQTGSGAAMLVMTLVGWSLVIVFIGIFMVLASLVWCLIDAFLLPGMVQRENEHIASRLTAY